MTEEFTADALAGMFSTDEGVNTFLDWLQKDSGYSQTEKKTILEKLSEWIREIVDAIKELLEGKDLNDVVKSFAKKEIDRFGEIRGMFLQVLDEIEGVEGAEGVKFSLTDMGFDEFSRETANNIKMRQGAIINTMSDLKKHIKKALNRAEKKNLYIGAIADDVKIKIESDIKEKVFKDKQYSFVVSYDDIIHISEHFGEDVENIAKEVMKLYDIIKHYDTVSFEITNTGMKKLIFDKSYSDYDYRTVEIASNKKATLDLVTLFVTKNNIKKRSQSVPPAAKSGSQWGSASTNSISNSSEDVNDSTKNSLKASLDWVDSDTDYLGADSP